MWIVVNPMQVVELLTKHKSTAYTYALELQMQGIECSVEYLPHLGPR